MVPSSFRRVGAIYVAVGERTGLDADRVASKLWIGSAPPVGAAVSASGFKVLVLCAGEYQPRSLEIPGVRVVHAGFNDSGAPSPVDLEIASQAADVVCSALLSKERTLVTCWQGRNRIGLVVALALKRCFGMSGAQAVRAVRDARPSALTNETFVRLLS